MSDDTVGVLAFLLGFGILVWGMYIKSEGVSEQDKNVERISFDQSIDTLADSEPQDQIIYSNILLTDVHP